MGDTLLLQLMYNEVSTTKKRINISLNKEIEIALSRLAKRDSVPQATKAAHFLRLGIEMEEDEMFDQIAAERDTKEAIFKKHESAWR